MSTMAARTLLELDGYEPDEMKSLSRKILRCAAIVNEEARRFYWLDRVKILVTKNPRLLVESLGRPCNGTKFRDQLRRRVCGAGKWNRDQYVAVQVMELIGNVEVDRNLLRLKELSLRNYAMETIENKIDWENRQQTEFEKEAIALEEIRKILQEANSTLTEEEVRLVAKHVLFVDQKKSPDVKEGLELVWQELVKYAAQRDDDGTLSRRLCLIDRLRKCTTLNWKEKELSMVLWGVYSLMNYWKMIQEPSPIVLENVISKTLKSKEMATRLPMEPFAVDVTTHRGRNCSDSGGRLFHEDVLCLLGSESTVHEKYDPIEASHGPSPHETKQTTAEQKAMIRSCEEMQSSDHVPRLFEMPKRREGEEGEEESEEGDERVIKRLKTAPWHTLMKVVQPEAFDEKLMAVLPATANNRSCVLDLKKGVSYEGPMNPSAALSVLAVSRLGSKVADLEAVPQVQLFLNATKDKIYVEKTLIGIPEDTEIQHPLTPQERSLFPVTKLEILEPEWKTLKTSIIKTFIFRRIMGMECNPAKCLLNPETKKIYMPDLNTSRKDYKRCRTTVKRESADWLFDNSTHREIIDLVSRALTEDKDCMNEVETWLLSLISKTAFEEATASILCRYTIPFEDFEKNALAVRDAYGIVPETDDECDEQDENGEYETA